MPYSLHIIIFLPAHYKSDFLTASEKLVKELESVLLAVTESVYICPSKFQSNLE